MIYGKAMQLALKLRVMTIRDQLSGSSQEARAARIVLLQEAFGLNRTDFATAIGAAPQTVYNWERTQNVSSQGAIAILNVFGVSTDWLLAGLEHRLEGEAKERIQAAITARIKRSA